MALTLAQLQDYVNANILQNGRNAITGNVMNYALMNTLDLLDGKQDALVSAVNIKTLNGVSLLGSGNVVISSGLTIGTTPITSGTDTRVLFQNGSVISQDTGFNFNATNKTLWNNGKGGITTNNSFGQNALGTNTTGSGNTAFGLEAGKLVTTGSNNTFVGHRAGGGVLASNFTGDNNTIVGSGAGLYLSSGIQNTLIGNNAGTSITTGSYNTIIGMNGTSFPSGFTQNVVISDGSSAVALWKNSSHFVGFGYLPASDTLGAKVDIKSQGALSTDLALRVRNSANTQDLYKLQGDGGWMKKNNAGNAYFYYDGASTYEFATPSQLFLQTNTSTPSFSIQHNGNSAGTYLALRTQSQSIFIYRNGNFYFGASPQAGTGTNSIIIENATAPTSNISTAGQLYVESGALKYRGAAGTVTTIANS